MTSSIDSFLSDEDDVEQLYFVPEEHTSSEEVPLSEWASYIAPSIPINEKRLLEEEGLFSPGTPDVCNAYTPLSASSVRRHVYYNYPALTDPGIKEALLSPELPVIHPDDGQELYLKLCLEDNLCPVRMFHRNLLNSEINLSYYGVNPNGIRAMALALQYNKNVLIFNLTENFLNDDCCYHLGQMLKINGTLQKLILAGCRIGTSGLLRLGAHLIYKHTLETLDLSRNNLGESGGVFFAQLISEGASVHNVNLSNNGLSRKTASALVEALDWGNPFVSLDLSCNDFNHELSTSKMLNQLAESQILEELNLSFASLEGNRIAEALYNVLTIPTLRVLDLSHNRLHDVAINTIMAGLINAKSLTTFNLSFNPMSPEDAYNALHAMLNTRVKLQKLMMDGICVNKSFVHLLKRVLRMKSRKNFQVTYEHVLKNWALKDPDARALLLTRADYIGKVSTHQHNIPLYFLSLNEEYERPVPLKRFTERLRNDKVPLNDDFIVELSRVFAGPKTGKLRCIDLKVICEYIKRLWPEKKLPPPVIELAPKPKLPPLKQKSKKPPKKK